LFPELLKELAPELAQRIEIEIKYAGYISRQTKLLEKLQKLDSLEIAEDFDFNIKTLRKESAERLSKVRPQNLGAASRVEGVTPADISILMLTLGY
jgi:tRNA uridine 5-carboxymethylaminomethyl modification enzyme